MKSRNLALLVAILTLPSCAGAQPWHSDASSTMPKPVAATPAESRILSVLERMPKNNETFLSVDADNGRMLRLFAESLGVRNAVEIGTSTGYSGLWTLLGLQATGGRLTTFEIDPGRAAQARKHFQEAGVDGQVTVVVGDAHQNVKQLKDPIDMLFLDADKEGYVDYLKTLLPLVRPGGIIAADNINSAPDYYRAVTTDPKLDTVLFGRFVVTMKKR